MATMVESSMIMKKPIIIVHSAFQGFFGFHRFMALTRPQLPGSVSTSVIEIHPARPRLVDRLPPLQAAQPRTPTSSLHYSGWGNWLRGAPMRFRELA
jgi:hypothetical protein